MNDDRVKNDCLVSGIDHVGDVNAVDAVVSVMKNVGVELKAE